MHALSTTQYTANIAIWQPQSCLTHVPDMVTSRAAIATMPFFAPGLLNADHVQAEIASILATTAENRFMASLS